MFTRRQRKPPKGGHKPQLQILLHQALVQANKMGNVRTPAAPWLADADLYLTLQRSCRFVEENETPARIVEERLAAVGLVWLWEGSDLVLEVPGWTPPLPVIVAVQPGLFDEQ